MAIVGWVERHPRIERWIVARMEASRLLDRLVVVLIAGQKARAHMSADNPEGIVWNRVPDAASLEYWSQRLEAHALRNNRP
ncbi:MAG: hypothetical protein O9322_04225 [Beijerinckiaceae bacterium]|nr:hypothetical protein [Beijerinckiaceae bacterium]MCZ8298726.1 hypothetical protein [Beijerinckiaceae bacterium]